MSFKHSANSIKETSSKKFVSEEQIERWDTEHDINYKHVEGTLINTDTLLGEVKNLIIEGNTIQDPDNLSDIRSVGKKLDDQELYEIPLLSTGKNLFNGEFESGALSESNGALVSNSNMKTSSYVKVVKGEEYILNISGYHLHMYDIDKAWKQRIGLNRFTADSDGYIRISVNVNTANVQLELGSTSTPYEPYQEHLLNILSPTPLEKVGDVADKLLCKDGIWGVEKNIVNDVMLVPNITKNQYNSDDLTGKYDVFRFDGGNNYKWKPYLINLPKINFESFPDFKSYDGVCHSVISNRYLYLKTEKGKYKLENINSELIGRFQTTTLRFIPLPNDQQLILRTMANRTIIRSLTDAEANIICDVPASIGGTLDSLNNLTMKLEEKVKNLENATSSSQMKYHSEEGYVVAKDTKKGVIKDLEIGGRTIVNRSDIKDLTQLSKEYNLDRNNVTLEGLENGTARISNIKGNSLVNLVPDNCVWKINDAKTIAYYQTMPYPHIKDTIIGNNKVTVILVNPPQNYDRMYYSNYSTETITGSNIAVFTKLSSLEGDIMPLLHIYPKEGDTLTQESLANTKLIVLPGDHTLNPPTGYFEGLQNAFEDKLVTEGVNQGKYEVKAKIIGKNKFNFNDTENGNIAGVGSPQEGCEIGNTPYRRSGYVQVASNTSYVRSILAQGNPHNLVFEKVVFYSANLNYIGQLGGTTTFTTPPNCAYIRVVMKSKLSESEVVTLDMVKNSNLQIEEGSNPTTYESYKESAVKLYLDEPLRGTNDTRDELMVVNNEIVVKRNTSEVLLKGTENWHNFYLNDTTKLVSGRINQVKPQGIGGNYTFDHINNALPNVSWVQSNMAEKVGVGIGGEGDHIAIAIPQSNLSALDIQGFKAWIQANNVTVVYQKRKPTYEHVTTPSNLNLNAYKGGSIHVDTCIPVKTSLSALEEEIAILPSTKYKVTFNADLENKEVKVDLGGTVQTITTKKYNSLTLVTPNPLSHNFLKIEGQGIKVEKVMCYEWRERDLPYYQGMQSVENPKLFTRKEDGNLFDIDSIILHPNATREGNKIVLKATGINQWSESEDIPVNQGETFTLQAIGTKTGGNAWLVIQTFDVKGSSLKYHYVDCVTKQSVTVTVIEGVSFIRVRLYSDTSGTFTFEDIQLVRGTTPKPYSHYLAKEEQLYYENDEGEILPIPAFRGINDDIRDTIEVHEDGKRYYHVRYGEDILKGDIEESWSLHTTDLGDYQSFKSPVLKDMANKDSRKPNGICDSLNYVSDSQYSDRTDKVWNNANYMYISLHKNNFKTLDATSLRSWLSLHPLGIVYKLSEEKVYPVVDINTETYEGDTLVEVLGGNVPSSINFSTPNHIVNAVKDVQDDVSELKDWKREFTDSVTHKKSSDTGIISIEGTKKGVTKEIGLKGKTLVNLCNNHYDFTLTSNTRISARIEPRKTYTLIMKMYDCNFVKGFSIAYSHNNSPICLYQNKKGVVAYKITISDDFVLDANGNAFKIYLTGQQAGEGEYAKVKDILILEGDHTQAPPNGYFESIASAGEGTDGIVVSSVNENLFDINDFSSFFSLATNGNELTIDKSSNKVFPISNGDGASVITYTIVTPNASSPSTIEFVFSDGTSSHDACNASSGTTRIHKFSKTLVGIKSNKWGSTVVLKDIMLNKGTTPKPYTPHKSDKKRLLYFNDETQTWEKPILREWDSVEKHSDGKYYYHVRSKEVVLNGSENWGLCETQSNNVTLLYALGHLGCSSSSDNTQTRVTSDKFTGGSRNKVYNQITTTEGISDVLNSTSNSSANGLCIRIFKSKLPVQDVTSFKAWLQANSTTVVYQLAQEKVYECTPIGLDAYDGETNFFFDTGYIPPLAEVTVVSNLNQVVEIQGVQIKNLEREIYDYKVSQNMRQLRTTYRSDYANFSVSVVGSTITDSASITITPYALDLFEQFKEVIAQGKENYDRVEIEEYIDFYVMTFVLDFEMAFELFDMIAEQYGELEEDPEDNIEGEIE